MIEKLQITSLKAIDGADKIELATILGWQCIVKKGEFNIGDFGLYFPIDSCVNSTDPRFQFLAQRKFRVKTIRMRGVLSQGLLLPLSSFTEAELNSEDLDAALAVTKYEDPIGLYGDSIARFPKFIVKTDQERIQNVPAILQSPLGDVEVTEKLDGTSATFFSYDNAFGICSRNYQVKHDGENLYSQIATQYDLESKIPEGYALQGEIIGPKIQSNKYRLSAQKLYIFDVFDINAQRKLTPEERINFLHKIDLIKEHVPIVVFHEIYLESLEFLLKASDGISQINPQVLREGIVVKFTNPIETRRGTLTSFKVISNQWLLKQ